MKIYKINLCIIAANLWFLVLILSIFIIYSIPTNITRKDMICYITVRSVDIVAEPTYIQKIKQFRLLNRYGEEYLFLLKRFHQNDVKLLAQLVQAEAGNQDLTGMRYVADVVLNRVDSEDFPNTVEEVIFQNNQFSVIKNGSFDMIKDNISENAFKAVQLEYKGRLNYDILYFGLEKSKYATKHFKYQDHWFGW